jgi:hypothetical protein
MSHYTYMLKIQEPTDTRWLYIGVRTCKGQPELDTAYLGSCRPLKEWINVNGADKVEKIILSRWPTRKEALSHEILLHDCFDVGRNGEFWNRAKQVAYGFDTTGVSHEGYNKGMKWTAEQRAAHSERQKGRVVSEETRMKIRLAQIGRPVPEERRLKHVGKKASEATRQKLRESHLGQVAWNKGLPFSEEAKAKMSAAKAGKAPWNKGRSFSEDTKRKMSEAAKKRCMARNEKGQFV